MQAFFVASMSAGDCPGLVPISSRSLKVITGEVLIGAGCATTSVFALSLEAYASVGINMPAITSVRTGRGESIGTSTETNDSSSKDRSASHLQKWRELFFRRLGGQQAHDNQTKYGCQQSRKDRVALRQQRRHTRFQQAVTNVPAAMADTAPYEFTRLE